MDNKLNLDKNENFFEFSDNVLKAIEHFNFEELKDYPQSNSIELCSTVADIFNLDTDNILSANGSYEALAYILNVFASERDIIINYPSSNMYFSICKRFGLEYSLLESSYDYTINLNKIDKTKNSLVILSNPNSESGIHITTEDIDKFLSGFNGILVIDEAYCDFSLSSCYMLIKKYANLFIIRSLSHSHSLAGLRIAFIISDKKNIEELNKVRDPYNLGTLTQIIADVAIRNTNTVRNNILALINERIFLDNELSRLGFLVLPSKANFLLVRPLLFESLVLYNYLLEENIVVKKYDDDRLKEYLRITVGDHKDNIILVSKIKAFSKTLQTK